MNGKKRAALAAAVLAAMLLMFSLGYLAGQLPVGGQARISLMSVPDPVVPSALPSGRIDINTASAVTLADIPGIGPVLAQRIIDRREENGPFSGAEDLLEVKGIGEKTLEKIGGYITYGGPDENFGG